MKAIKQLLVMIRILSEISSKSKLIPKKALQIPLCKALLH